MYKLPNPTAKPLVTTTYTVVGISSNGCKDSASITVNVSPLPPNLSGGNRIACFGETVQLGVPPRLITDALLWSPAINLSCATCINPVFTPPAPGVYIFTETVTDVVTHCVAIYHDTVTVHPTPLVSISGPTLACGPAPFSYCPTVTGGTGTYTYSWNVIGGSTTTAPCPHGIHVTWANATIGGNVILNVSDSNGCIGNDTLFVRGCCVPNSGNPYSLKNDTLSTFKPPYPPGVTKVGSTFYIHSVGTLNVDGLIIVDLDLVIFKSSIFCGTNAKFLVTGGHSMTVDTSHIYACANMWDGIYLNATPTVPDTLKVKNSVIEDAENAVVSVNGAPYFINSSLLNKNFVGIKVEPYAGTFSGTFTNSYITCDSLNNYVHNQPPLRNHVLPPGLYPNDTLVSLKAPHAGFRSYIGIDIGTVNNIRIGNTIFNNYQDLDYGIYSHNSNVTVNYEHFYNMDSIPVAKHIKQNTLYPCGILALGGTLGTGPYTLKVGLTAPCGFTVCKYGIWARDSINAYIENNGITGSTLFSPALKSVGINITDNYSKTLEVSSNTIHSYYIGVNAYRNVNSNVIISKNGITGAATWSTSYGVDINEFPPTPSTHYMVDSNSISSISSGIYAVDLDKALIDHNLNIRITGNGLLGFNNGIYTSNSLTSRIINNTINYIGTKNAYGIRVDHGNGNVVSCNTIDFIGTSPGSEIAFWGPQTPNTLVDLNSMIMNTRDTGIHLLMRTTNIGHQGSVLNATANCWSIFSIALPPPYATFVDNGSNLGSPIPTQFYVAWEENRGLVTIHQILRKCQQSKLIVFPTH